VHHLKRGNELLAVGFIPFVSSQTLVVSSFAIDPGAASPSFGAGVALWAAGLALVSAAAVMPASVRITGAGASLLFAAAVARQIHGGIALTPLSRPSPFTADPFPVLTLFGWAWVHVRSARKASSPNP
jgi:hypothetical protein